MLYNFNVSNGQREDITEIRALYIGLFHTPNFFVFICHLFPSLKLPFNRCKSDFFFQKSLYLIGRAKFHIKTS